MRPDLRPGLRVIPYGRSVVIAYQVAGDTIEILRIFYGGQDYETIMMSDEKGGEDKTRCAPAAGYCLKRRPSPQIFRSPSKIRASSARTAGARSGRASA